MRLILFFSFLFVYSLLSAQELPSRLFKCQTDSCRLIIYKRTVSGIKDTDSLIYTTKIFYTYFYNNNKTDLLYQSALDLSDLYIERKQYDNAEAILSEVLKKIPQDRDRVFFYKKIKDICVLKSDYRQAYIYLYFLYNQKRHNYLSMYQRYKKRIDFFRRRLNKNETNARRQKIIITYHIFLAILIAFVVFLIIIKLKNKNKEIIRQRNNLDNFNNKLHIEKLKVEEQNRKIIEQKLKLEQVNKELQYQKDMLDLLYENYYHKFNESEKHKEKVILQKQEVERINKELRELSKFRELYTQMIVHDLKNPLHRIISTTKEKNRQLYESAQLMLNLVENIINVSKIEQKVFVVHTQQIVLNEVIAHSYRATDFLFRKKGVSYENRLKAKVSVLGDFEILKRIFINLFTNAVKYTESGGKVVVSCEYLGEKIKIKITDTGTGVKQEDLKCIFKLYSCRTEYRTDTISSSGIGLFFVKKAVEAHNSEIMVQSEFGKGACFCFDLDVVSFDRTVEVKKKEDIDILEFNFTEAEQKEINRITEKLQKKEIYEVSELKAILRDEKMVSENIRKWKKVLLTSIENYNTNLFNQLLNRKK